MRIGIDPGVMGAMAVLDDKFRCIELHDMPTMPLGKKHLQINAAALADLFNHYPPCHVYLEEVHAMPKQGVSSTFNFGTSYGVVQGVCGALDFPLILVRPAAWKKSARLVGKPKDAARTLAQHLYPEQNLSLKKHLGRADALLIARFGELVQNSIRRRKVKK